MEFFYLKSWGEIVDQSATSLFGFPISSAKSILISLIHDICLQQQERKVLHDALKIGGKQLRLKMDVATVDNLRNSHFMPSITLFRSCLDFEVRS